MTGEWVRKAASGTSVVFVHGILSDGQAAWQNENGTYWPRILAEESALDDVGIYVFGYRTGLFSGHYSLNDAVDALKEHMRLDGVLHGKSVVFVCHSMGGIVVRKYLVQRATELVDEGISVGLFLVASPSLGSSYADWLKPLARALGHAQADALRFEQANTWLSGLDTDFKNLKESDRLRILGKELVEDQFVALKKFWRKQLVEPFTGARYFGEHFKVPGSDHFSIAKPGDREAIQHRLLRQFLGTFNEAVGSVPTPTQPQRTTPGATLRRIFVHQYMAPRVFVAREVERREVVALLTAARGAAERASLVAVTAVGGVGKSCLCRELVEEPDLQARFARIVWFSFYDAKEGSEDRFLLDVLELGLESPVDQVSELDDLQRSRLRRRLCEELDDQPVLLVLDGLEVIQNARDPDSADYGSIQPRWAQIRGLLKHVVQSGESACLINSRVPLREFENVRGFAGVSLDLFTPQDGAVLLRSLGVQGSDESLATCADTLGGHALTLVAAGRYMARKGIVASEVGQLVGDADAFRATREGEKVKRIVDWLRKELSEEQEHFLTRLSLHPRAVTEDSFTVLVKNYTRLRLPEIERLIVQPLVERGLIDRTSADDGVERLSAHPLLKLAYSAWLQPDEEADSRVEWARAAESTPGLHLVPNARSLAQLQPLIDATQQYLAAKQVKSAWRIFSGRDLGLRLGQLGHLQLSLDIARTFEAERATVEDWSHRDSTFLYDLLAWLSGRLGEGLAELDYRRKELEAARGGPVPERKTVERSVAEALASAGFVHEAQEILRDHDQASRDGIALYEGRFEVAVAHATRKVSASSGHDHTVAIQDLGEALSRAGQHEEALTALKQGLGEARVGEYACCERGITSLLVDAELRYGRVGPAKAWADDLAALRREQGLDTEPHTWLLVELGELEAAAAAAAAAKGETPRDQVSQALSQARISAASGREDEALAGLAEARAICRRTGYGRVELDILHLARRVGAASASELRPIEDG